MSALRTTKSVIMVIIIVIIKNISVSWCAIVIIVVIDSWTIDKDPLGSISHPKQLFVVIQIIIIILIMVL